MKTLGIICEYNPFHNGHKFHIEKAKKELSCDGAVCVMSGSFVQRGEVAILDKWTRAKSALLNGCDLVLELPSYFCMQSSKEYAYGGVSVLNLLGNVDFLSFGSEDGDIQSLKKIAKIKNSKSFNNKVKELVKSGMSYPAANEKALGDFFESTDNERIFSPNNLLGIEYINALKKTNSNIIPHTIKRHLTNHLETQISSDFATASMLRQMIKNGEGFDNFIPYNLNSQDIFDEKNAESFILGYLRLISDKNRAVGDEEGLLNHITECAKKAVSLEELYDLCANKRYTKSRIKRVIKCAILDVKKLSRLDYIRVLGFNDTGRKILKNSPNKNLIVTKTADFEMSKNSMFKYDILSTDFMYLCANDVSKRKSGMDFINPPVYIKSTH